MKKLLAIPTINKELCTHFGHCEQFTVIKTGDQKIANINSCSPAWNLSAVIDRKGCKYDYFGRYGGESPGYFCPK